jgi:hypothetical protein
VDQVQEIQIKQVQFLLTQRLDKVKKMWIIIDKETNKIEQTMSANYGLTVSDGKLLQEVTNSELIKKIESAYEYELVLENGLLTNITVSRSISDYNAEQELLNSLIPTDEEIRQAETELLVIEILTEGGLI